MEEIKNPKMKFFQRLYKSIIDFDIFSKYIEEPLKVAIRYLAIIVLIYSIIVTGIYVFRINNEVMNGMKYIENSADDINIEDSILSYNNGVESIYEEENNLIPIIIINTSEEPNIEDYKNRVKLYNYGFILLKDRVLVYTSGVDEFESIKYTEIGLENMDKQELISSLESPSVYIFLSITIFIAEFIQYFIYTLFLAVILAVVGQIISLILRLKMSFKSTYIIGIYALTLPTVLNALYMLVNSLTGFVIQYFNWMYTTISYIYVCVAILMIKTDFINLRREMMRIKLEEEQREKDHVIEGKIDNKDTEDDKKEEKNEKGNSDEEDNQSNDLKEQTDT